MLLITPLVRWHRKQLQLDRCFVLCCTCSCLAATTTMDASTDPRHNPNLNRDQSDPEFWYHAARRPFNKAWDGW